MPTLREVVDQNVREGDLYESLIAIVSGVLPVVTVPIPNGQPGVCKVRFNRGGVLLGSLGIHGRSAVRSDREEAPSFMAHRGVCLQLWNAWL